MLTIQQIAELKQAVKTEMARRSGNGSLASFSGADWEFTIQPESGGRVLAEHGKKVINPLLEVADIPGLLLVEGITPGGETPSGAGDPIPAAFDGALLDKVANYGTDDGLLQLLPGGLLGALRRHLHQHLQRVQRIQWKQRLRRLLCKLRQLLQFRMYRL